MNETVKAITERSSCRKFKPEHITDEEMDLIVKAGLNAPSGGNQQTPRLVVVRNDEIVKKLSVLNVSVVGVSGRDPFYGAPDVVLVLVKNTGTCVEDGSLALGNMLNAAYSMGIGARWIHRCKEMFESDEGKALLKEWGITEDVRGVGCCILGYPDEELVTKEKIGGRVFYVN